MPLGVRVRFFQQRLFHANAHVLLVGFHALRPIRLSRFIALRRPMARKSAIGYEFRNPLATM